ncbi:I78 family peptidase inhibitor [Paracoccus sp. (in: a-proteobacteria)]|uniref:I78 family peptidase inhibitor n=1 Tax=Paracoccus sp. TaxID=267 RepID=UPI0026DFA319|nr:I78 family peptidase inhibitor [Paracoccus sp. (in: a-proteobacteria)]MDO5647679.1 I78 family peptidase inhibitor [Paracoccus sp. (in: a-proteobacteria)]
MKPIAFLAAALTLAACDPVTTAPAEPDLKTCGADGLQGLVGQPREAVARMSFPIGTRLIGPDDAVTSDFRPDRLNIETGRSGRIERVGCY